ncbi:MAG TPA: hypothetical protein DHN33_04035, partial [Eubacteriaceae bacterium]|nr:hypothetical protein [Eubacteriaceae bacterium]
MITIKFTFDDQPERVVQTAEHQNLLDICRKNGIGVDAPCNGNGTCGKCLVKIVDGYANKRGSQGTI